jgi:hypothetical protein
LERLKRPPAQLSEVGRKAFDVLAEYTSFPGPVLAAQLKRHGLDPATVDEEGLATAMEDIATGVARFTSPEKGEAALARLRELVTDS